MPLTTRTRYALRMLVDIAANQGGGNVKIKDISQRQGISPKYLEQIVTILGKAGYVQGERGPLGGYRLSMDPGEVTVADVLVLLEGTVAPSPCVRYGEVDCPRADRCTTVNLWRRVDATVMDIFSNTTIQDLLDEAVDRRIIEISDNPELDD